jgi:purine-cytosine permease-like protein
MSPETLKEAKHFKTQAGWCALLMWVASAAMTYMSINKPTDMDWVIVPVGAGIFTVIYFNMRSMINKYESLTKK